MPTVTITLTDTPAGGVAVHTEFKPAIGAPCSAAQSAALDIISRTKRDWGMTSPPLVETITALAALPPMQERGR